jgi:DNA-binding protein HU-beta
MANENTIGKGALVDEVAEKTGLTKTDVDKVLKQVIASIAENVKNDKKIILQGFGTFKKQYRKERDAVNPQNPTGPKIHVDACEKLAFKSKIKF